MVFSPSVGLVMLACGTVPMLAGVIAVMGLLTLLTGKEVAAECLRAALRNILHGPQLRGRHPVAKCRAVLGAVDTEDVSELSHHRSHMWRHAIMRFRSVVMTIAPVVRFSQEGEAIRLRRAWSEARRGKQYDAARSASFNQRLHLTPGSGGRWLGTVSVAPAQVKRGVRCAR